MKKEFGKGEEQYRSLLAKNPDDLETRAALGDLYMASGDRARAGSEYESIRKKAPAIPIGYVKLAELYQSQGKWDRAAAEMEQAARLNPRADAILASLVQIRLQQKRPEAAAALLEARGKQNPNDAFVRYLLGQVRAAQGDNRKAEESFLRAMELSPENVAPYLSLAQLYTRNREYAKAIPVYEKVLARQPDHWAAANDLAFLLCEGDASGKDLDRALNLAERARRLRPEEGTVLDTMGWIYHRKGDFQKAVDLLQRVQAKAPDSPIANYHLGMALAGAGKREQAREMLRKSLAAKVDFPGREDARKALEKL
jgi:tetratricopeptide (TPR) repeat protein